MDSISITPDVKADPALTATAPNIVDTANGGVQIVPKTEAPAPERPTWLPEKFKSAEDMASAYAALESKMGKEGAPKPAATPVVETPAVATPTAEETAAQTAAAASLHAFAAEAAGGADQLPRVLEWAKANLSADEQAAYNAAVDSGNGALVKLAMSQVLAQYKAENGTAPRLVTGGEVSTPTGEAPFQSNAQVTAAMRDPRYRKDPAYRKSVENRLARSNF